MKSFNCRGASRKRCGTSFSLGMQFCSVFIWKTVKKHSWTESTLKLWLTFEWLLSGVSSVLSAFRVFVYFFTFQEKVNLGACLIVCLTNLQRPDCYHKYWWWGWINECRSGGGQCWKPVETGWSPLKLGFASDSTNTCDWRKLQCVGH